MTVSPETLDTALCEWCTPATPAVAIASYKNEIGQYWVESCYVCNKHCQEIASEMVSVNLYPVANKPEYTLLETYANPMTGEYTIKELETAARYGAPYPVCGDLTAKERWGRAKFLERVELVIPPKESWTGHDPNGTQY